MFGVSQREIGGPNELGCMGQPVARNPNLYVKSDLNARLNCLLYFIVFTINIPDSFHLLTFNLNLQGFGLCVCICFFSDSLTFKYDF